MIVNVDFSKNSSNNSSSHKGGKCVVVELNTRPVRYGYYTEEESRILEEHALKMPEEDLFFREYFTAEEFWASEENDDLW